MNVKSAIFISDIHAHPQNKHSYTKIIRFLKSLENKLDILFILGDAFEFWFNDRPAFLKKYNSLLESFQNLSKSGTKLVFFEGNHDIRFGKFMRENLKADIHSKCISMELNQKKIFLGHGDELSRGDNLYRFWRKLLRLKITVFIISQAPSSWVFNIAMFCSKLSRWLGKKQHIKQNNQTYINFASKLIDEGYNAIILAHTHIPAKLKINNGYYLNPGDWMQTFSYIEFKDETFSLKYFQD